MRSGRKGEDITRPIRTFMNPGGGGCEMAGSGIEGFDTTDEPAAHPGAASTGQLSVEFPAASPPPSPCMLQPGRLLGTHLYCLPRKTRLDPVIRKYKIDE